MSPEFWSFFAPFALIFLIAGTVIAAFLSMRREKSGRFSGPESRAMWVKPLLLVGAAAGFWGDVIADLNLVLAFAIAFVIGLGCGLTAVPPMLFWRDLVLGSLSAVFFVGILVSRLGGGGEIATIYLLYLAALGVGLLLGGLKTLVARVLQPINAIAALGGIEMIDYLLSPFGITNFPGIDAPTLIIGAVAALVLGVLIRIRPTFVVILGGLSITLLAVVLQVFLWFEMQNFPGSGIAPDWTAAVAWLGIAIGYPLTRTPFVMSRARSLS